MYKPAQIDFSPLGGIGQKIGQMRQDRNALPWARSDWQGAPQGYAMGWHRQPWMQSQGNRFMDQQGLSRLWANPQGGGQDYGGLWKRLAGLF